MKKIFIGVALAAVMLAGCQNKNSAFVDLEVYTDSTGAQIGYGYSVYVTNIDANSILEHEPYSYPADAVEAVNNSLQFIADSMDMRITSIVICTDTITQ